MHLHIVFVLLYSVCLSVCVLSGVYVIRSFTYVLRVWFRRHYKAAWQSKQIIPKTDAVSPYFYQLCLFAVDFISRPSQFRLLFTRADIHKTDNQLWMWISIPGWRVCVRAMTFTGFFVAARDCIIIVQRQPCSCGWLNAGVQLPASSIWDVTCLTFATLSLIVQELCESRGGRPGLSVLTSLLVSVEVKNYWTVLRHWSQLVPNMSTDIWGH